MQLQLHAHEYYISGIQTLSLTDASGGGHQVLPDFWGVVAGPA